MNLDMVAISAVVADALTRMEVFGDVEQIILPVRAAWICVVLAQVEDTPERFPRGKWATIQAIEQQVSEIAGCVARRITA